MQKLTQRNIVDMIRSGDVNYLRHAVWNGLIKVPQDLVHLGRGDTALHVAAKYGQVEVLQYLVAGLCWQEGDEIKTWGLDASMKNHRGHTAKYLAQNYSNSANNKETKLYMAQILDAAEITEKSARAKAMKDVENISIPKRISPKRIENFHVPQGNANIYTGRKDAQGETLDGATLYMEIRKKYNDLRQVANKEREVREDDKREFLSKAESGELSAEDVKKYIIGRPNAAGEYVSGRLDCKVGRKGDGALHLALKGGHVEIVKMLLEGVEVDGRVERVRFDDKARDILKEVSERVPPSKIHQEIISYLERPKTVFTKSSKTVAEPLDAANQLLVR